MTGTPFSITRTNDIAGVGDGGNGQPVDLVGDLNANANGKFSAGAAPGPTRTSSSTRRPSPTRRPAAFGNSTRNIVRNPGDQQWDLAIFKNFSVTGTQKIQFRVEMFNFINHPNLSGRRPTSRTRTSAA